MSSSFFLSLWWLLYYFCQYTLFIIHFKLILKPSILLLSVQLSLPLSCLFLWQSVFLVLSHMFIVYPHHHKLNTTHKKPYLPSHYFHLHYCHYYTCFTIIIDIFVIIILIIVFFSIVMIIITIDFMRYFFIEFIIVCVTITIVSVLPSSAWPINNVVQIYHVPHHFHLLWCLR